MNLSKTLLISTLPVMLLLSGCFGKTTESTDSTLSNSGSTMNNPVMSIEACKEAVTTYLEQTKLKTVDTSKKVKTNTAVVVDYVGRLADGTVFDTSVESVAKACGLYTTQRNYSEWLPFTVWVGQMIAGFDKWVVDMALNETKTINIPAAEAYGEDKVSIPLSELPTKSDGSSYKVWESIMTMNGAIEILAMDDKEFTIKNNHPLAWKDLIFDITVKEIK